MAKVYSITMKDVADRVGVSRMTVSLALRGHQKISAATTEKVRIAAKELGYNPNPYLSALGSHIRSSKQKGLQAQLAYLCHKEIRSPDRLQEETPNFEEEFYLGAIRRAESLGYGIERVQLDEEEMKSGKLNQTLSNRGIMGLIVWRHYIKGFEWNIEWDRFALCTMGVSRDSWDFHSVECDRHRGMSDLIDHVRALGYKRPGLVMLEEQDHSHHHIQRSVVSNWQLQLPTELQIPHLIDDDLSKKGFFDWLDRHNPDVVICGLDDVWEWVIESGRSIPQDIGFVRPQITERKNLSGIRYDHGSMGEAAVDVIAGQINYNERGIPRVPKSVLISGKWQAGESLRKQSGT
ncbi:MAG: LacI family transcriptional regulator [Candidatus Pelagisphaera sp.]|jgi:LacI family transcriptional regulator